MHPKHEKPGEPSPQLIENHPFNGCSPIEKKSAGCCIFSNLQQPRAERVFMWLFNLPTDEQLIEGFIVANVAHLPENTLSVTRTTTCTVCPFPC
jgi:hypothetical protein